MQRLTAIDPAIAAGTCRAMLDLVDETLGMVPNVFRTLAQSPAALQAYLSFNAACENFSLDCQLRAAIALAVSEANSCHYCVSAATAKGRTVGLSTEQISDARRGQATDSHTDAAVRLAVELVRERGQAKPETLRAMRQSGFSDGEIAEVVALVGINTFSNYFNMVAQTELDFPAAEELPQV